jgi:uncharacterized protein YndB with AHSA1/START domain
MMPPSPDGETAAGLQFTLVRYLDAPREKVFRMWSEPQLFRAWSAPTGFRVSVGTSDFRPGGAWHCHMVAPDGTAHRAGGLYLDILAPESIVMSHSWEDANGQRSPETCLSVSLDALGERTRLSLHQGLFADEAERDGHQAGWSECLDALADQLHALATQEKSG